MDNAKILEGLFDGKKIRIIQAMMQFPEKQFYLRELAKIANVPPATTFRVIQKLIAMELVTQVNVSKFKLYQWKDNERTKFIEQILKEDLRILSFFIDELKNMSGVQLVVQHGKEQPDKANLLIIGDFVNADQLKKISLKITEKYHFKITYLTLTEEQYHQMLDMGLYAGQKKIIYDVRSG
ncbi:MAG: hypothetical protein Q8O89_00185 [Nanoarchaeota archaeon]|nr:hypothetical protein [Nanoarchaeota archaeon]